VCIYPIRSRFSCRRFWRHLPPFLAVFILTFLSEWANLCSRSHNAECSILVSDFLIAVYKRLRGLPINVQLEYSFPHCFPSPCILFPILTIPSTLLPYPTSSVLRPPSVLRPSHQHMCLAGHVISPQNPACNDRSKVRKRAHVRREKTSSVVLMAPNGCRTPLRQWRYHRSWSHPVLLFFEQSRLNA
jgi:hypothetical protein